MKMTLMMLLIMLLLAGSFLAVLPARAATDEDSYYRQTIPALAGQLRDLEARLKAQEPDSALINEYLNIALWFVYSGKAWANCKDATCSSTNDQLATTLVDGGFLPFWPCNPLNNWEPLRVLSLGDGFAPGELCFCLCPPDYASTTATGGLLEESYDMYIYGITLDSSADGEYVQFDENKEWCQPPAGARYGLAYHTLSQRQRLIEKELIKHSRNSEPGK